MFEHKHDRTIGRKLLLFIVFWCRDGFDRLDEIYVYLSAIVPRTCTVLWNLDDVENSPALHAIVDDH